MAIGTPLPAAETSWTVCDGERTTVIAGPVSAHAGTTALSADEPVLVSGPTGTAYLLYDGQRAALDPTEPAVSRALGLAGITARGVSSAFLNTIPEAVPITVPRVHGAGGPAPAGLAGFSVGDVIRVDQAGGAQHYVVLDGGVQPVGMVTADLIRFSGTNAGTAIPAVAATTLRAMPSLGVLPVATYPDRTVTPQPSSRHVLCATWVAGAVSFSVGSTPPIPPTLGPVQLAQADGGGPAVDEVFVPPGRSVYVRPEGGGAPTGSIVVDTGVRFGLADAVAARILGLPDTAAPAPWALLAALPAGPELRREAALVARDVVADPGSAQPGEG
jgi:type VII secretion protein EccB